MTAPFKLRSDFTPKGDQPNAIRELVEGLERGDRCQTLLGITGSGKTFTVANVIQHLGRPTLIIAPNKTLAAQLYGEMRDLFPPIHDELLGIFERLERHYRDMCDTEFTIEQGKLWMLQTRVGKRTGAAALKMAVDMTKGSGKGSARWKISREDALTRLTAEHLDQVLHPQFAGEGKVLTSGLAASPGAAVGKVYFTADDAEAAAERGEKVILVRSETSPEDVHGMMVAEGILTARGGLVSHAAVVARGWGKPAVVGAEKIRISGTSKKPMDDLEVQLKSSLSVTSPAAGGDKALEDAFEDLVTPGAR